MTEGEWLTAIAGMLDEKFRKWSEEDQRLNIRKLHRGKGRIRCEIQPTFFWCSFLRIKKEGQGFLPGIWKRKKSIYIKKVTAFVWLLLYRGFVKKVCWNFKRIVKKFWINRKASWLNEYNSYNNLPEFVRVPDMTEDYFAGMFERAVEEKWRIRQWQKRN